MGHSPSRTGVLEPSLDLGQEVEALDRVFDRRVLWERLDRFQDLLFCSGFAHITLQEEADLPSLPSRAVGGSRRSWDSTAA